jgi:hypothetical protein
VIFIDLRDREGLVQAACDPDREPTFSTAEDVRNEFCLKVVGRVRPRTAGTENATLPSGKVEVLSEQLEVLSPSVTQPFHVDDAFFIPAARSVLAHPIRPYSGTAAMDDIDRRVFARSGETPTTFVALSHPPLVPYVIAGVAAAAGVPRTATVRDLEAFTREFNAAAAANDLATLVAKVDATGPAVFLTDLGLLENRFQFQRALREWPRPASA